jgi:hypothetical protein
MAIASRASEFKGWNHPVSEDDPVAKPEESAEQNAHQDNGAPHSRSVFHLHTNRAHQEHDGADREIDASHQYDEGRPGADDQERGGLGRNDGEIADGGESSRGEREEDQKPEDNSQRQPQRAIRPKSSLHLSAVFISVEEHFSSWNAPRCFL